ncbi:MAG: KEOPS complex subunit Pcc1 [Thermoplasmata archaeon]
MRELLRAFFTFELGAERNEAVLKALGPELRHEIPRASARAWLEGASLRLEITAQDPAALRAAVNSYLRWVRVAAEAAGAGAREGGEAPLASPPERGAEALGGENSPRERESEQNGNGAMGSASDGRAKGGKQKETGK